MSDFNSEKNRFVWMDIPVDALDRACVFYEGVLGVSCHRESMGEIEFAVLRRRFRLLGSRARGCLWCI